VRAFLVEVGMRRITSVWAVAILAGCSAHHGGETDAGGADSGETTADAGSSTNPAPVRTVDFGSLNPGEEKNVCSRFRLTNTAAMDVVKIETLLSPDTHQLAFYLSPESSEQKEPYDCAPLAPSAGEVPFYLTAVSHEALPLPTGVSFHLPAGQMIRAEAHIVNTTTQAESANAQFALTPGAAGTYQAADIMLCGSVKPLETGGVPPGTSELPAGFYQPPAGTQIFGLETREYARGNGVLLREATSAQDASGILLERSPTPVSFDDAHLVQFSATQGIRWQCFYNNHSQTTFSFGFSEQSNEQCFWWGYYFPSAGHFISQECLQ
jgi:hypothetical protein